MMFVVVILQGFLGQDRFEGVIGIWQWSELEHAVVSLQRIEDHCNASLVPM